MYKSYRNDGVKTVIPASWIDLNPKKKVEEMKHSERKSIKLFIVLPEARRKTEIYAGNVVEMFTIYK